MQVNDEGLKLIKNFEGRYLEAYQDPIGIWTIGYGHTSQAGFPHVEKGLKISAAEADDILKRDLNATARAVSNLLKRTPTAHQFSAMVSLAYNIGVGNFARSSVLRHFNAGQDDVAAQRFLLWNKAGGRVLRGLTNRRNAEATLFQTPN